MISLGGGSCYIMGNGSLQEITAEVGMVIQALHTQLGQSSPILAKLFRQGLVHLLTDPETPIWTPTDNHTGICITVPNNSKEEM